MNPQSPFCFPPLDGRLHHDKPGVSVSSFDCDVLRSAFIKAVINENIPEDKCRALAASLISDFTGSEDVDPELLDWIVRK